MSDPMTQAVALALHHTRCTMVGVQTKHIRGPLIAHHVEARRFAEKLDELGYGVVPKAATREAEWQAEMAAVDAETESVR